MKAFIFDEHRVNDHTIQLRPRPASRMETTQLEAKVGLITASNADTTGRAMLEPTRGFQPFHTGRRRARA